MSKALQKKKENAGAKAYMQLILIPGIFAFASASTAGLFLTRKWSFLSYVQNPP